MFYSLRITWLGILSSRLHPLLYGIDLQKLICISILVFIYKVVYLVPETEVLRNLSILVSIYLLQPYVILQLRYWKFHITSIVIYFRIAVSVVLETLNINSSHITTTLQSPEYKFLYGWLIICLLKYKQTLQSDVTYGIVDPIS